MALGLLGVLIVFQGMSFLLLIMQAVMLGWVRDGTSHESKMQDLYLSRMQINVHKRLLCGSLMQTPRYRKCF